MFSMSLDISISVSGFLNFMLAYFLESVVPVILETSERKTQNLNSMQLLQGKYSKKTQLVSADYSILKRENMSSKFRNEEASSSRDAMEKSGEAEQLSAILKILEEENEMMKQALLETVMERKELVNEICQLFNTLCYNLHWIKDGQVGHRSRQPCEGGGTAAAASSSLSQILLENSGFGDPKAHN